MPGKSRIPTGRGPRADRARLLPDSRDTVAAAAAPRTTAAPARDPPPGEEEVVLGVDATATTGDRAGAVPAGEATAATIDGAGVPAEPEEEEDATRSGRVPPRKTIPTEDSSFSFFFG